MVRVKTASVVRLSVGRTLVSLGDEVVLLCLEFTKPSLGQAWQTMRAHARLKFDA